ncbi:MAG: hypothetical protein IH609_03340 [Dehalococcoidia bacterium]|nr:hypothetical protein [Dehalococcoidia bacterium]
MSSVMYPIESEATADMPPGAAPSFGDLDTGIVHEPAPLVLSESAHRSRQTPEPLLGLNGRFYLDDLAIDGQLMVEASPIPGMVHIHADMAYVRGGGLEYDAQVRESWVTRASALDHSPEARAGLAKAIADLARLPHQSTVTVSFTA